MREAGAKDEQIREKLVGAGWKEADVNKAFGIKEDILIPVPKIQDNQGIVYSLKVSDEDTKSGYILALLYFIKFVCLWIGTFALIYIISYLFYKMIPDNSYYNDYNYYSSSSSTLKELSGFIASLVVCSPIYIFLFIHLKKMLEQNPMYYKLKTRKFLIFLTLISAFLINIITLISGITLVLNGYITGAGVLTFITIILILSVIFFYYYKELTNEKKHIA